MRLDSIPSELTGPWLKLRLLSYGMLSGSAIYLIVMALIAHGQSDGAHSLLDWPGSQSAEARENEGMVIGLLLAIGIVDFAVAFLLQGYLLRREPSKSSTPAQLLETPAGRAFAQFRAAKFLGLALADSVAVVGLIIFVMFGRFLQIALPTMILAVAGVLVLFPTEQQLLKHLEERLE